MGVVARFLRLAIAMSAFLPFSSDPVWWSIPRARAPLIVAISIAASAVMDVGSRVETLFSSTAIFMSSIMSWLLLLAAPSRPRLTVTPACVRRCIGEGPEARYMLLVGLWETLVSVAASILISLSDNQTQ